MGSLTGAWLVGEGIVIWRQVHAAHKPPAPGVLIAVTALFLGLSLISDAAPPTRQLAGLVGWGLDIAGILNLPGAFWTQVGQAASSTAKAEQTAGTNTAKSPTVEAV
jgi:hypothetical protein